VIRVEDHDDLMPIFERLTDVLSETYGDYYLAELIEAQDDNMKCIVAEVDAESLFILVGSLYLEVNRDSCALGVVWNLKDN